MNRSIRCWLTALHCATTACGSVVIGLALVERHLDAEAAWQASQLDETFQIERWGEDAEAAARRAALKRDIEATDRFLRLLRELSVTGWHDVAGGAIPLAWSATVIKL